MTTTLEHNELPARFNPETMCVHTSVPINPGETVHVCAWCDSGKLLTSSLILAGYEVSHGVCQKCKLDFIGGDLNRKIKG